MDTSWLADLRALAKTLNFSRAAELRNITQPAFGRRIRSLEAWCGSPLVKRGTHRLAITEAGKIMLEAAEDVTRRLERARHDLEKARASTAALTFVATHALSFTFFPGWFQAMDAAVSTMPLRLLSDNMSECEKILLSGGAQFLLCHHHQKSPTALPAIDFQSVVLGRDRLIPVSRRNQDGGAVHRLPGSASAPVPWMAFDKASGMGRILAATLSGTPGMPNASPVFTSHLAMVLKALAADGKGVAWIPESLATDELGPQGRLAIAGSDVWSVDVEIALFRNRARMSDAAERFWKIACRERLASG